MIDLYTWPTPNGFKISIMLEEVGLPYNVIAINIGEGDQFDPDYLQINPNNKMPTIVDQDGPGGKPFTVFESGAILIYLAEKSGQLMPTATAEHSLVMQWLMFQMANVGPMLGQAHHFRNYTKERLQYAFDRYTNETSRIYGILDKRLGEAEFVAGEYSIADVATAPWLRYPDRQGQDLDDFPNIRRWRDDLFARPAWERGFEVLADRRRDPATMSEEQRANLFGDKQYARK
jgi:GST-like protein